MIRSEVNILVVDDFQTRRVIIRNFLNEIGFENIFEVSDGYNAMATLKSKIFDCVIIEWEISEISGLELLKKIRQDILPKNFPVLIATEDGIIDNLVSASRAGASGFLLKPFKKESFSEKFEEIFKKNLIT